MTNMVRLAYEDDPEGDGLVVYLVSPDAPPILLCAIPSQERETAEAVRRAIDRQNRQVDVLLERPFAPSTN